MSIGIDRTPLGPMTHAPMGRGRNSIRVLIADDTATLRLVLRRTLEASQAFEVVGEAVDGAQAVHLAEALKPDIVLLDLSMPVLGGMDAIPLIRHGAPDAQIVVLSEFPAERIGPQVVAIGAAAFLGKQQCLERLVPSLLQMWRSSQPQPAAPVPPDGWFRTAFEHAPLPMALVGAGDDVVYANPALCRLTGYGPEQLCALTVAELTHPDDRYDGVAARAEVSNGRRPSSTVDARLLRPDGRAIWAAISCSATGDSGSLVVQMVDVTEQRWTEQELTRSNAELGSFAYLAAHELKAPLQTVSGFAGLLDHVYGPGLEPQAREFVSWIVEGAGRMNALIEDLLAYCSVDVAETVLEGVPLDGVMAEALNQLDWEVTCRGAVVTVDPLPTLTGDSAQFGQLLQNLLANALKFVPEGRRPEIHVSAERMANGWTLTMADNGIGVEDAAKDRIFAMFERVHPRERYKGTGIGLSVCKRIVERRGGTIWVEPNPSGGSRFRFKTPDVVIPVAAAPAA